MGSAIATEGAAHQIREAQQVTILTEGWEQGTRECSAEAGTYPNACAYNLMPSIFVCATLSLNGLTVACLRSFPPLFPRGSPLVGQHIFVFFPTTPGVW